MLERGAKKTHLPNPHRARDKPFDQGDDAHEHYREAAGLEADGETSTDDTEDAQHQSKAPAATWASSLSC